MREAPGGMVHGRSLLVQRNGTAGSLAPVGGVLGRAPPQVRPLCSRNLRRLSRLRPFVSRRTLDVERPIGRCARARCFLLRPGELPGTRGGIRPADCALLTSASRACACVDPGHLNEMPAIRNSCCSDISTTLTFESRHADARAEVRGHGRVVMKGIDLHRCQSHG